MHERIERSPARVNKNAKRKQCRTADSVLTMDQHLAAALCTVAHELHALLEMLMTGGLHVGGRQVQKLDPGGLERCSVVAFLGPQIDDGADPEALAKIPSPLDWKAAADRDSVRDPMEIRLPIAAHQSIFFFNIRMIFFFNIFGDSYNYCCFCLITAVVTVTNGTTKLRNCSASV